MYSSKKKLLKKKNNLKKSFKGGSFFSSLKNLMPQTQSETPQTPETPQPQTSQTPQTPETPQTPQPQPQTSQTPQPQQTSFNFNELRQAAKEAAKGAADSVQKFATNSSNFASKSADITKILNDIPIDKWENAKKNLELFIYSENYKLLEIFQ